MVGLISGMYCANGAPETQEAFESNAMAKGDVDELTEDYQPHCHSL